MSIVSEHTLRRSADTMLPFLVGIIIGVLASFAAFSGRVATLEANDRVYAAQIASLEADSKETNVLVHAIAFKLGVKPGE